MSNDDVRFSTINDSNTNQLIEAISKILIEFTAKKAASTPEQHADPIKIIIISRIKP